MKGFKVTLAVFTLTLFLSFFSAYAGASSNDDMGNSEGIHLKDIIPSLKSMTGMTPRSEVHKRTAANSGMKAAVYILRNASGAEQTQRTGDAENDAAPLDTDAAMTMKISHATGGISDPATVDVTVEGGGIAGAAFTVVYGPHIILNAVDSNFFDTFTGQGLSESDGLDSDGTIDGYDKPLVTNEIDEGATAIAAARATPEDEGRHVLFTLSFSLKPGASPGTYPINIRPTVLNNEAAGYDPAGETIDMLIGIDSDSFPVLIDDEMNEDGYSAHVEPGSVTFASGEHNIMAKNDPVSDAADDLSKAILTLKVLTGMSADEMNPDNFDDFDLDKDGKVGIKDFIYMLQIMAGLRPAPNNDEIQMLQSEKTRTTAPDVSDTDLQELVAGNTAFALSLYQFISEGEGNLFFSPHSISLALGMTYTGARTETETEMANTLQFTLSQDRLHPAFNALDLALESRGESAEGQDGEGFRLNIANSIWGQTGYPFLDTFLDVLAENYGAGMRLLDFSGATDASRVIINNWVSDQTEEKIKDLLPPGSVSASTCLVLTNAIYFNAAWKFPFEEELTQDAPFYLTDGESVSVPMMSMPEAEHFGYFEGDGYEAVELRYDGDEMSMVILIPDAEGFDEFEASLTSDLLDTISGSLESTSLDLKMPKFKYESGSVSLKDVLTEMGMPAAFSGVADFSGINEGGGLFISDVIHKAFVSVDEAGTEAAAATAVIMDESIALPDKSVTIDRPFIFFIRDIETGAVLFVGRIVRPEA